MKSAYTHLLGLSENSPTGEQKKKRKKIENNIEIYSRREIPLIYFMLEETV